MIGLPIAIAVSVVILKSLDVFRWQLKSLKQRFVEKCLKLSTFDKLAVSLAFESSFSKVIVDHMIFSSRFKYCLF